MVRNRKLLMQKNIITKIVYDLVWFISAIIIAMLFILPINNQISRPFFYYLFGSFFLIVTYFRGIVFMSYSILFSNIWIRLLLLIGNIPLFIFVLRQYYVFIRVFDDYNYTLPITEFQHVLSGTEVEDLLYIKKLAIFAGSILMFMIVLMEMRIIQVIFKERQLDKFIRKV